MAKLNKGIRQKTVILIEAAIGYIAFEIARLLVSGNGERLSDRLNVKKIIKFLLCSEWPLRIGGPIWYLHALLLTFGVVWLLAYFKKTYFMPWLIVICLIINSTLGEFSTAIGIQNSSVVEFLGGGNSVTRGIPFVLVGCLCKKYLGKLQNCRKHFIILGIGVGVILPVVEIIILTKANVLGYEGCFIGNVLLAFSLFCACIQNPMLGEKSGITKFGKNYSLGVYLIHQPLGLIVSKVCGKIIGESMGIIVSVLIFVLSFILCFGYKRIKEHISLPRRGQ